MIALASGLPVLQIGDCGIREYSAEWLEGSIRSAAKEAGHSEWWFAADIVKSLFLYLRERFTSGVITVNELFEKLRLTLGALGFQDIADHLHDEVPPCRIQLHHLALEASASGFYEWRFFTRLAEMLDEARRTSAEVIVATESENAVKVLLGAKRWTRACQRLHEEIVAFVQNHVREHHTLKLQLL